MHTDVGFQLSTLACSASAPRTGGASTCACAPRARAWGQRGVQGRGRPITGPSRLRPRSQTPACLSLWARTAPVTRSAQQPVGRGGGQASDLGSEDAAWSLRLHGHLCLASWAEARSSPGPNGDEVLTSSRVGQLRRGRARAGVTSGGEGTARRCGRRRSGKGAKGHHSPSGNPSADEPNSEERFAARSLAELRCDRPASPTRRAPQGRAGRRSGRGPSPPGPP